MAIRRLALVFLVGCGVGAGIHWWRGERIPTLPVSGAAAITLLVDDDYGPAVLATIREARSSIDLTMFSATLPDDARPDHPVLRLIEALGARHQEGVQVRVVLDAGPPQPGRDRPNAGFAERLIRHGVQVRWDGEARTTHVKCLVADGRWSVMGSHNWSYSALRRNREQSLLIDSPELARILQRRFEELWRSAQP